MEKQLEVLTTLMARQAQEAQRREERLSQLLERMVTQQQSQSPSGSPGDDTTARGPRFPASATTVPHLTSSASLREFDAWRHKFEGYESLTKVNLLPKAEQRAALTAVLDDEWTRILRYGTIIPDDA